MRDVKELAEELLEEYERIYPQDRRGEIAPGDFEALARVALEFCEERRLRNHKAAEEQAIAAINLNEEVEK